MRRLAISGGIALALVSAPMTMLVGAQASGSGWSYPADGESDCNRRGAQLLTAVACPSANYRTAVGVYSDRT